MKQKLLEKLKKNPKAEYQHLFNHHLPNLEDEIHLKGGRIVTPKNLLLLK